MSKKAFLANPSNKQALINLIALDMSSAGIIEENSDYMICLLACSSAKDKPTVVADDTVFQLIPPLTLLNYIMYMGPPDRSSPLKLSRITWTISLYDHCSSYMLLMVVIPHRGLTGLER